MSSALWLGVLAYALIIIAWKKVYLVLFVPWLYIPRDEFHSSLGINMPLLMNAPPWFYDLYMRNNSWRRQLAHKWDLERKPSTAK